VDPPFDPDGVDNAVGSLDVVLRQGQALFGPGSGAKGAHTRHERVSASHLGLWALPLTSGISSVQR
jgi:hypothetical protein